MPTPAGMILANHKINRVVTKGPLSYLQRVQPFNIRGGREMNGLDQIIVYLWFFPVVLFIIIPLCVSVVWLPVSLFIKLVQREAEQEAKREEALQVR